MFVGLQANNFADNMIKAGDGTGDGHCSHGRFIGELITGHVTLGYETLMYGSLYGPVVIPRDPEHSVIIMLIEGRADKSLRMPHDEDESLSEQDIATLRLWVKQGAKNTGE